MESLRRPLPLAWQQPSVGRLQSSPECWRPAGGQRRQPEPEPTVPSQAGSPSAELLMTTFSQPATDLRQSAAHGPLSWQPVDPSGRRNCFGHCTHYSRSALLPYLVGNGPGPSFDADYPEQMASAPLPAPPSLSVPVPRLVSGVRRLPSITSSRRAAQSASLAWCQVSDGCHRSPAAADRSPPSATGVTGCPPPPASAASPVVSGRPAHSPLIEFPDMLDCVSRLCRFNELR